MKLEWGGNSGRELHIHGIVTARVYKSLKLGWIGYAIGIDAKHLRRVENCKSEDEAKEAMESSVRYMFEHAADMLKEMRERCPQCGAVKGFHVCKLGCTVRFANHEDLR